MTNHITYVSILSISLMVLNHNTHLIQYGFFRIYSNIYICHVHNIIDNNQ